jgi:hypothetical protein
MKVGWYYHRLRAMTVSELAHRVTERWKHRSDASFVDTLHGVELGDAAQGIIALPQPNAAPAALKQTLASDAASLMRGEWKLFGWREVNVGAPPQWHRDLVAKTDISPDQLAHQLNHRALPDGADSRTIWEISRWSEMVRLAMHAYVNNDVSAAKTAVQWIEDWCDKNPVGYGINWTSPLEAGLRLLNFVWFDALVERSLCALQHASYENVDALKALERAQRTLAERIVPAHAAWVWRYRSFGSSANNHLLGELVGLLHAMKRWPALEKSICSAEALWQEISRCVLEQFAEDGGNKEQALHYHLFAWEMAWHAAQLMRVPDGPVIDRLKKAADFLVHVAHDSEQWEYGDNDDAQIVPLTSEREHAVTEWRGWMSAGSDRRSGTSIAYWLGHFPVSQREGASVSSSTGWWLALQSGMASCNHDGWTVRLDASPLGFGKLAAHGHGDALHVSIWDGPRALLIDPGTGGYFGAKELRTKLAAWEAHNGPQPVGGFQTPRRAGTFLWMGTHDLPSLSRGEENVCAEYRHEGHALARSVETNVPGEIHIIDRHHERGALRTRWHFAPECRVSLDSAETGTVRIEREAKHWNVRFFSDGGTCDLTLTDGTASRAYGRTESCCVLEVIAVGAIRSEWRRDSSSS